MQKAKEMGIEAYLSEQRAKKALLTRMLEEYDDGYHDVFFCLAANMLGVDNLESVINQADELCGNMTRREKADCLMHRLQARANERGILLILRR